jgi:hypothetical protein
MLSMAKIRVKEAEAEVLRAKEWLRGLEAEIVQAKNKKVSEGSEDTRTLLNG